MNLSKTKRTFSPDNPANDICHIPSLKGDQALSTTQTIIEADTTQAPLAPTPPSSSNQANNTVTTTGMSPPLEVSGDSHVLALPNELIDRVAECLFPPVELSTDDNMAESRRALLRLSLVSKRLHDVTAPKIFFHIHVGSARKFSQLVSKLLARPELLRLIQKLSLSPTICRCAHHPAGWCIRYGDRYVRRNLAWLVTESLQSRRAITEPKDMQGVLQAGGRHLGTQPRGR